MASCERLMAAFQFIRNYLKNMDLLSSQSAQSWNDSPKYTSRTWGLARTSSAVPEAITVP